MHLTTELNRVKNIIKEFDNDKKSYLERKQSFQYKVVFLFETQLIKFREKPCVTLW